MNAQERIVVQRTEDFPPRNVASLAGAVLWDFSPMRVIEEPISVFRDAGETGLTLVMGGYRVAMTRQEARALLRIVHAAMSDAEGESAGSPAERSAEDSPDHAAVVAKVTEQVISWSQIAEATRRK